MAPRLLAHHGPSKNTLPMALRDVPLPDVVYTRLLPDRDTVLTTKYHVDAGRWQRELAGRGLDLPEGTLGSVDGWIRLSRADILLLADPTPTQRGAMDLLWYSLAWGLGSRAPRLAARLDAVAKDPQRVAELVAGAWTLTRDGANPAVCYAALLTSRGRPRVSWLGGAFATKVLYFAHGTQTAPRNLILDKVVADKLRPIAWETAPTTAWWPDTYQTYCDLMSRWAGEASERAGRSVEADEIEGALFLT